jgi:hypothetical protein
MDFREYPRHSVPCGGGHASEIKILANQYVRESRVRLLRPISHSLLLAHLGESTLSSSESLPTSTQVNFANDLDVLLAEIVRVLR